MIRYVIITLAIDPNEYNEADTPEGALDLAREILAGETDPPHTGDFFCEGVKQCGRWIK